MTHPERAPVDNVCLTAAEVALVLGVSRARVYELARRRILPAVRLGRSVLFHRPSLERFLENSGAPLQDRHGGGDAYLTLIAPCRQRNR